MVLNNIEIPSTLVEYTVNIDNKPDGYNTPRTSISEKYSNLAENIYGILAPKKKVCCKKKKFVVKND